MWIFDIISYLWTGLVWVLLLGICGLLGSVMIQDIFESWIRQHRIDLIRRWGKYMIRYRYFNIIRPAYLRDAISSQNLGMIKALVELGLHRTEITPTGRNAFHHAIYTHPKNRQRIIQILTDRCSGYEEFYSLITQSDSGGSTPLHLAIRQNDRKIIPILLRLGSNPINSTLHACLWNANSKTQFMMYAVGYWVPDVPPKFSLSEISMEEIRIIRNRIYFDVSLTTRLIQWLRKI